MTRATCPPTCFDGGGRVPFALESLGFALSREEQLLGQFVASLDAAGAEIVRNALAIAWAKLPSNASTNHWAKRLGIGRTNADDRASIK